MRKEAGWSGLKILVTGATGFIGRNLCQRLYAKGSEVHATSRQAQATIPGGAVWWQADMAQFSDARRVFAAVKPDIIFHLSGSVGAQPDLELVLPTYHSLLTSTVNVLVMAAEIGCGRVVLAGSLTEPVLGTGAEIPTSPYAAAKWAGSTYGRMFHKLYGTPVVVLRPFMTYGPAQAPSKLIPSVINSLLKGEAPRLSSGRVRADWVYIADVVEAFLDSAVIPDIEGQSFDIGTGRLISIRTVVEKIIAVMNSTIDPVFGVLGDRPAENEIAANTGPADEQLGWRGKTSLDDGLRQTVEWYRAAAELA
jgi:nucleoside-diphosphate-sugar epimerase